MIHIEISRFGVEMSSFMVSSRYYLREAKTCLPETAPQKVPMLENLALVFLFGRLSPEHGDILARRNSTGLFILLTFATRFQ